MDERNRATIEALRREIGQGGARPAMVDAAVAGLVDRDADGVPAALLSLLSDAAPHDEAMFTLIHAAERADDGTYVAALLDIFPHLSTAAPRWASIVLMRVLNDTATRSELVRQLADAPAVVKAPVRTMVERINAVSPQFLARTVPVLVATG